MIWGIDRGHTHMHTVSAKLLQTKMDPPLSGVEQILSPLTFII